MSLIKYKLNHDQNKVHMLAFVDKELVPKADSTLEQYNLLDGSTLVQYSIPYIEGSDVSRLQSKKAAIKKLLDDYGVQEKDLEELERAQ